MVHNSSRDLGDDIINVSHYDCERVLDADTDLDSVLVGEDERDGVTGERDGDADRDRDGVGDGDGEGDGVMDGDGVGVGSQFLAPIITCSVPEHARLS